MRHMVAVTLALAVGAATGGAQATKGTIDPGMSKEQVVERLGRPAGERTAGAFTYLYYPNGCERRCGTPDVVTLELDVVIDAIIRSPARRYTGASSSPKTAKPAPTGTEAIDLEQRSSGGGQAGREPPRSKSAESG